MIDIKDKTTNTNAIQIHKEQKYINIRIKQGIGLEFWWWWWKYESAKYWKWYGSQQNIPIDLQTSANVHDDGDDDMDHNRNIK